MSLLTFFSTFSRIDKLPPRLRAKSEKKANIARRLWIPWHHMEYVAGLAMLQVYANVHIRTYRSLAISRGWISFNFFLQFALAFRWIYSIHKAYSCSQTSQTKHNIILLIDKYSIEWKKKTAKSEKKKSFPFVMKPNIYITNNHTISVHIEWNVRRVHQYDDRNIREVKYEEGNGWSKVNTLQIEWEGKAHNSQAPEITSIPEMCNKLSWIHWN